MIVGLDVGVTVGKAGVCAVIEVSPRVAEMPVAIAVREVDRVEETENDDELLVTV